MPRLDPLPRQELSDFQAMFEGLEGFFGFLPNDYLTMARKPAMLEGLAALTLALTSEGAALPREIQFLLPYMSSRSGGCMYCTAHAAKLCEDNNISLEKIQNILAYETHPIFSDSERAALRLADKARRVPNRVSDEDFVDLRKHFDEVQITEIIGLTSMMAFYNTWNETVATTLEKAPLDMATDRLQKIDWVAGKHAAE